MDDFSQYLDLIEDTGNIGYWNLNLQNNEVFWSPGVYRIHGVSSKEFKPSLENTVKFYHPDDRSKVILSIESAIENKEGNSFDLRIIRSDNTIRHIRSTFKCMLCEKKEVTSLFGVFQDMTEQVSHDLEIAESHSFLKAIIDHVPDFVFVKDRQSKLVLGNIKPFGLYMTFIQTNL